LALSRQLGDRRIEGDNLDNIGGTYWALGDYEQAIDFYSQALEIRRATDDLWGIAISQNNLATAWRDHGQPAQTIPYYEEALAVNRQMGRRRGEGYVRHGQGLTHLEAGELELAHERLTEAAAIRRTLGERDNLLETMAILALTELQAGQIDSAKQKLQTVLETIGDETDRAALRQWVHYVAFQFFTVRPELENAKSHLRRAEAAMLEIAEPLSSTDREQFLKRLPLNRKIRAALAEFEQSITVQLVRETVPLGRRLVKADYQPVRWTIYALSDEAFDNPAERRRHILSRLLTEAKAQGAAPTDADLAAALNVSRRTILRDMNQLRTLDPTLTTRRRSD
jgi:tetratricopeptide (TPR) repeat protein